MDYEDSLSPSIFMGALDDLTEALGFPGTSSYCTYLYHAHLPNMRKRIGKLLNK